ncbi:MAG: hypothetical protein AVDCRST_MAG38-1091, partial [uncultured Solirubrobacteraceae bacterium]
CLSRRRGPPPFATRARARRRSSPPGAVTSPRRSSPTPAPRAYRSTRIPTSPTRWRCWRWATRCPRRCGRRSRASWPGPTSWTEGRLPRTG